MLDDVTIVLQGYPYDINGLIETYKKYLSQGFKNIVISSYEKDLGKYKNNFDEALLIFNDDIFPYDKHINGQYSIFKHINTTVRGIKCAREVFGINKTKYIFKCRCDHSFTYLDKWVEKWKGYITNIPEGSNNTFDKKLILLAGPIFNIPWYLCDYWSFGTYEDSYKYWDINLNSHHTAGNAEMWIATSFGIKYNINLHPNKYTDYFIFARDIDPYIIVDNYSFKFKNTFYDKPGSVACDDITRKQIQPKPLNPF